MCGPKPSWFAKLWFSQSGQLPVKAIAQEGPWNARGEMILEGRTLKGSCISWASFSSLLIWHISDCCSGYVKCWLAGQLNQGRVLNGHLCYNDYKWLCEISVRKTIWMETYIWHINSESVIYSTFVRVWMCKLVLKAEKKARCPLQPLLVSWPIWGALLRMFITKSIFLPSPPSQCGQTTVALAELPSLWSTVLSRFLKHFFLFFCLNQGFLTSALLTSGARWSFVVLCALWCLAAL